MQFSWDRNVCKYLTGKLEGEKEKEEMTNGQPRVPLPFSCE
jgi:hypothetical protein